MINQLRTAMLKQADSKKAETMQRFFKTGIGDYGYGDIFLGLTVPQSRLLAKQYYAILTFADFKILLTSEYHEERLIALLMLVFRFEKTRDITLRSELVSFYLNSRKAINNWDLVDLTADKILGAYVADKDKKILLDLAKSKNLWDRRIAIIATFHFIKKQNDFFWTFKIAEILLQDKEDLIHKAAGWMLREVGKRINQSHLEDFLKKYYKTMPRTMLRYALEKFPEKKRQEYLQGLL